MGSKWNRCIQWYDYGIHEFQCVIFSNNEINGNNEIYLVGFENTRVLMESIQFVDNLCVSSGNVSDIKTDVLNDGCIVFEDSAALVYNSNFSDNSGAFVISASRRAETIEQRNNIESTLFELGTVDSVISTNDKVNAFFYWYDFSSNDNLYIRWTSQANGSETEGVFDGNNDNIGLNLTVQNCTFKTSAMKGLFADSSSANGIETEILFSNNIFTE